MDLQVKCIGIGYPVPTIWWFKDGKLYNGQIGSLTNNTKIESILTIRNISSLDEGLYRCQLNNSEGTVTSRPSLITVYSKSV